MSLKTTATRLSGAAVGGIVAYVVGYALTYALSISAVRESGLSDLASAFGEGDVAWQIVGWVFYNAHFVTTTVDVDVPFFGGTSAVNFIARGDALSPVLYVVPPALLVVAGLAAARMAGVTSLGDAVRVGAAVTLGYLPLAALGTVLFSVSMGSSSGQPAIVTAVVLAGIVYPAAFGLVGAGLAAVFGPDASASTASA